MGRTVRRNCDPNAPQYRPTVCNLDGKSSPSGTTRASETTVPTKHPLWGLPTTAGGTLETGNALYFY